MFEPAFSLFMQRTLGPTVFASLGHSRTPISLEAFNAYPEQLKPLLFEHLDEDFYRDAPLLGYGPPVKR